MIFEIASKNMTMSTTSRNLVVTHNLLLKRYFKRIYSIQWTLEVVKKNIEARILLHAYSGNYRATASGSTIREVIVSVCDTIERQRRRKKRIVESARRRSPQEQANSRKSVCTGKLPTSPEDFGQ